MIVILEFYGGLVESESCIPPRYCDAGFGAVDWIREFGSRKNGPILFPKRKD